MPFRDEFPEKRENKMISSRFADEKIKPTSATCGKTLQKIGSFKLKIELFLAKAFFSALLVMIEP